MTRGEAYKANDAPYDVAIVGGGIAGLSVALRLPEHMRVALFTKGQLGESNTRYAQGGIAAAVGEDDSPELHFRDTLAAGAGLCDEEAVHILVDQAPRAVRWLIDLGVRFDRAEPGSESHVTSEGLLLGREGAHSRWRVLHAGGDATGAEIERALVKAVLRRPSVVVYEETFVSHLTVRDGICIGLQMIDHDGRMFTIQSRATVLANGGAGGLWLHTSNPSGATADGLALAWRAGAALTDLEFMQFHPTVLVAGGASHLISEAVRGEGAYLRNHAGERFMPRYNAQAELAPRDIVARAILSEMLAEQKEYQFLDLRHLPAEKMYARFPTISAICQRYGLDLARDLLPIAPAAHYCMGGIMVDTYGQTTLTGLYAVGEVACTGVHGANRLASNSLLEGLVYGMRVADVLSGKLTYNPRAAYVPGRSITVINVDLSRKEYLTYCNADEQTVNQINQELRRIMWRYASLSRDEQGLRKAQQEVLALQSMLETNGLGEQGKAMLQRVEVANMLQVAILVISAALYRQESRGSHWRSDCQPTLVNLAGHHFVFQSNGNNPSGIAVSRLRKSHIAEK